MPGSMSPCDGMHVCIDSTSAYTVIREFYRMESEPTLTPREKSLEPECQDLLGSYDGMHVCTD